MGEPPRIRIKKDDSLAGGGGGKDLRQKKGGDVCCSGRSAPWGGKNKQKQSCKREAPGLSMPGENHGKKS